MLLDDQGRELAHMPGSFQGLDSRLTGASVLVATLDNSRQQAMLTQLDSAKAQWSRPVYLPARDYSVAGLCLYRDEEGKGEQCWWAQVIGSITRHDWWPQSAVTAERRVLSGR